MKNYLQLITIAALVMTASPSWSEIITDAERLARIDELYQDYRQDFPNIGEVNSDTLSMWINSRNVVLVDVRKPKEREISQIPNSISQQEFEDHPGGYSNELIVVYCTVGYRSGNFTRSLLKDGVKAYNLEGGILSWVHHKGTVEHEGATVQKVHVYGQRWSLLPAGFVAVW